MELYQRQDSKAWWVSYSINGRRFRKSTGTKSKDRAKAFMAKLELSIYNGTHFPERKKGGLTMAQLRDLWLEHAQAKRSIKNDATRFKAIVDHFGAAHLVATLTKRDIEQFRDALARRTTRRDRKMAPATVNRHLALLRSALKNVEGDYLHRNPMKGVKFLAERNKRERLCEPVEYQLLIENAAPDLRLAITLAFEAGLRRVEVCKARREHVNQKRREIQIPAGSSKNDEPRTIPLSARAMEEIKAAPSRLDGRMVGLELGELTLGFRQLCARLEIQGLNFHDLRGTAITRLARRGANLDELQKFSGHKSVQALMKYLKRGDERLRKLVDRMDADQADA